MSKVAGKKMREKTEEQKEKWRKYLRDYTRNRRKTDPIYAEKYRAYSREYDRKKKENSEWRKKQDFDFYKHNEYMCEYRKKKLGREKAGGVSSVVSGTIASLGLPLPPASIRSIEKEEK